MNLSINSRRIAPSAAAAVPVCASVFSHVSTKRFWAPSCRPACEAAVNEDAAPSDADMI